jgi:hypothetical protein
MTLSITTFYIMTLSLIEFNIMTLNMVSFRVLIISKMIQTIMNPLFKQLVMQCNDPKRNDF